MGRAHLHRSKGLRCARRSRILTGPVMRTAATPLLLCLAAFVVAGVWQVGDFRAQRDEQLDDHRRQGLALLAAVEGLATREFRGGRYEHDSLEATLNEALKTFDLEWVSLESADGGHLGDTGPRPEGTSPTYIFESRFKPLRPRRDGRGPRWGSPGGGPAGSAAGAIAEGPVVLTLILPPDMLEARLAARFTRFVVTSAALALAILLFGGVFLMRTRSLEMRGALEAGNRRLASLEVLRRVGAGLVHETKNPLGVVRGFAERIVRTPLDPEQLQQSARAIIDETDRTVARLDEFLLFSRPAALRRTALDVRALFDELATLLDADLETADVELVIECCGAQIDADHDQIRRLFLNLLLNAIQAIEPGGRITVSCQPAGGALLLTVEDDGPGVPAALHSTLF